MGGDEFVIVAPGLKHEAAREKALRINEMAKAIGAQIGATLSVSIGSACSGEDGSDAEQLLAEADRRMYSVKRVHHENETDLVHFTAAVRHAVVN
jgi:diguanylate cyclase (GGDEF)-like protein